MLERAVVNAGPLVALALLERLDLLPSLFGEVWIPDAVFEEVALVEAAFANGSRDYDPTCPAGSTWACSTLS